MILAPMIWQFSMMSLRLSRLYFILTSTSSWDRPSLSSKVLTFIISSFLFNCFSICSRVRSSPLETMTMLEMFLSSVSPTVSESMLKHRLQKRPATFASTPERFSTRHEYMRFIRTSLRYLRWININFHKHGFIHLEEFFQTRTDAVVI